MVTSSPIPRAKQPKWHESSGLQSIRESDSTPRQWLRARTNGYNTEGLARQVGVLTQQMGKYRRRIVGGGASDSSTATAAFAITELGHQDYFVAKIITSFGSDGNATVSATSVKIAKVKNVRRSIVSQLLYGDTVTYTDDDASDIDNTRIANNGVDAPEPQDCIPPYITMTALGLSGSAPSNSQCIVYAKKLTGLTGVFDESGKPVEWLEDCGHDGVRAFAERDGA